MRGQWIGDYVGTTAGVAVVELDDMGSHFQGTAVAFPNLQSGMNIPPVFAQVRVEKDKKRKFNLTLDMQVVDVTTAIPVGWETVAHRYPGVTFDPQLHTEWEFDNENKLHLKWSSNNGTSGSAHLHPGHASLPSELTSEKK
jgi:hypothetical protein